MSQRLQHLHDVTKTMKIMKINICSHYILCTQTHLYAMFYFSFLVGNLDIFDQIFQSNFSNYSFLNQLFRDSKTSFRMKKNRFFWLRRWVILNWPNRLVLYRTKITLSHCLNVKQEPRKLNWRHTYIWKERTTTLFTQLFTYMHECCCGQLILLILSYIHTVNAYVMFTVQLLAFFQTQENSLWFFTKIKSTHIFSFSFFLHNFYFFNEKNYNFSATLTFTIANSFHNSDFFFRIQFVWWKQIKHLPDF